MSYRIVLQNLSTLSYIELGMLRELIDRLVSREQWQEWNGDPQFDANRQVVIRDMLRELT